MNSTPTEVEPPCWQVGPTRDSDLFWQSVDRVVPSRATFEVDTPFHIIDLQRFVDDFEKLRRTRGLESATRTQLSVESMVIKGLDNLQAVFREYFHFSEFLCATIYDEEKIYLSWHDMPDDPMYLRGDMAEDVVAEFSRTLGVRYRWIESWQEWGTPLEGTNT